MHCALRCCAQGYTEFIDWRVTYITYLTLQYITSYVFIKLIAPTVNLKKLWRWRQVGGSTTALSCIWRVTFSRWKSFSFGTLIDIDNPISGPLSIFT